MPWPNLAWGTCLATVHCTTVAFHKTVTQEQGASAIGDHHPDRLEIMDDMDLKVFSSTLASGLFQSVHMDEYGNESTV